MEQTRWLKGIDWIVILLTLGILGFGILNIYSVDEAKGIKELVLFGVGIGMLLGAIIINLIIKNFFQTYSWIFYILGLFALGGVLIVGREINGAKAWYHIGSFTIQPAEFVKLSTALFLAFIIDSKRLSLDNFKSIIPLLIIIALPILLIMKQPDLGSVLVYFAFFIAMYREGLHWGFVTVPILGVVIFLLSLYSPPLQFLISVGYLVLILFSVFCLFLNVFKLEIKQYIRGVYAAIGLFFVLLLGVVIFQYALNIESMEMKYLYLFGLNTSKSIYLFFIVIGILICAFLVFLKNKNVEDQNPFAVSDSGFRNSMATFIPIILLLITIATICFSSQIIFKKLPNHHQERVMILFEGEGKYRHSKGYNLLYSKTAIGSGELYGKGFKKGTVKAGGFVPEQQTDYIFCTVGEEWGFVGSSIVILAYCLLILRLFWIAENQNKIFNRFFGYSVSSIILIHFIINIGMVTGLFPTVGIPLPFFSYGGSSLWAFTLLIGVLLILNYERKNSLF